MYDRAVGGADPFADAGPRRSARFSSWCEGSEVAPLQKTLTFAAFSDALKQPDGVLEELRRLGLKQSFTVADLWGVYEAWKSFVRFGADGEKHREATAAALARARDLRRAIAACRRVGVSTDQLEAMLGSVAPPMRSKRGPKASHGKIEFVLLWDLLTNHRRLDSVGARLLGIFLGEKVMEDASFERLRKRELSPSMWESFSTYSYDNER
jgi:hypothetical protein